MTDTLRGIKPSENIADFLGKFEMLSLGRSATHTKLALEKFAKILNEGGEQEAINKALRELLGQITFSISQYATMEPDSASSAHQFIEISSFLISSLADLYGNLGSSLEFWETLQDYSENSGNIDGYKAFLTRLYQATTATPNGTHSIGSGQVFESSPPISAYSGEISSNTLKAIATPVPPRPTDLGVGNLQPSEPLAETPIPKAPAPLLELKSLYGTTEQPSESINYIDEETTVVSRIPAALAAQTTTARPSPADPMLPTSLPLLNEEPEEDKTNPHIDVAALSLTTSALLQQRRLAASVRPEAPAQKTEKPIPTSFTSNSAKENNSSFSTISTPININPEPESPTSKIEISQPQPLSTEEIAEQQAKQAPFTKEGNAALGLPVFTPENPAPPSTTMPGIGVPPIASRSLLIPYVPSNNGIAIRQINASDATKITRLPERRSTPKAIKSHTRGLVASIGLAVAGVLGVGVWDHYSASRLISSQNPMPSASISNSTKSSEAPQQPPKKPLEQTAEPQYESGIYKVDTKHAKFKKYLDSIKSATGLVALIKDFAGQTSIQYEQNPAKFAELQKSGKVVLNGTENELDMRIAIAEKMVETALAQKIENSFVRHYFQNQKKGLADFKLTKTWTVTNKDHGVDKFFDSIQLPEKYVTPLNIIGYAPDIDPVQNPSLKKVAVSAPNFYRIFLQVGKEMQVERDAFKVVPYRDFNAIKTATCKRIDAKGKTLKTPDERSGIAFMHRAWCSPSANPYNDLNKSLMQVVEITEQPANPTPSKNPTTIQPQPGGIIPNTIILKRVNLLDTPTAPNLNSPNAPAQPTENPDNIQKPKPKVGLLSQTPLENRYAAAEVSSAPVETKQPIYFSRTINRIKSWFGFGKSTERKTAQIDTTIAPNIKSTAGVSRRAAIIAAAAKPAVKTASAEPLYTKKDLPLKSWTQTIKEFFWA